MTKCRSCGAEIIWVETENGKKMPCNSDPVTYWKNAKGKATIVTPNGEVCKADLEGDINKATGYGYISHFATCPQADKHRRKR